MRKGLVKWKRISIFPLISTRRRKTMSATRRKSLRSAKNVGSSTGVSSYALNKLKVDKEIMKITIRGKKRRLKRLSRAAQKLYEERGLDSQTSSNWGKTNKTESFNTTIDLCMDDSSIIVENVGVNLIERNEDVIEINKEPNQEEVIDLTGNGIKIDENTKPTVIDLSQEEETKRNQVNDDIFVIGTFSKTTYNEPIVKKKSPCKKLPDFIPLSCGSNALKTLINLSDKLSTKSKKRKKNSGNNFNNKKYLDTLLPNPELAGIGENISVIAPVSLPISGLRPIIIDGSNVGFINNKEYRNFSSKRLEICIKYFKEKGHKVTAFLPQFRMQSNKSDDPNLLRELEKQGDLVFTPSKKIDGRTIVPYDDRFIVQTAVLKGGVIVSRDNYNDLLKENPAWSETIKYRTLAFTWVDDILMFPKDPLGEYGPSLEDFLKF